MDNIEIHEGLLLLGFKRSYKIYRGFRPHYIKGDSLLFLIGGDFWPSKIYKIGQLFKDYESNVYGIITSSSPFLAAKDWATSDKIELIGLKPLSKGQWNSQGDDIEYVPIEVI